MTTAIPADHAADAIDQLRGRSRGAPSRQDVVDDQHAFPRPQRVGVDLDDRSTPYSSA